MKNTKQITPVGQMSNLVNMYVIVPAGKKVACTGFVYGKADEYYIIQWHNQLTGEPITGQLFLPSEMKEWIFLSDRETADYVMDDYRRNMILRYTLYKKEDNENKL